MNIPKKIWFLWFQGKSQMPEIVKMCYDSWCFYNPDWEIVFLSDENLSQYVNLQSGPTAIGLKTGTENIPLPAQSDIIRINLLEKQGGVWVDATCYCNQPLSRWLDENLTSGFFAFNAPRKDRMISSWFMAAAPNNTLVKIYSQKTNELWANNPPAKLITNPKKNEKFKIGEFVLRAALSLNPWLWHSNFMIKRLRQTHYFWFHYLFGKIYHENKAFKEVWDNTPKISAGIPMRLMRNGFNKPVTKELKYEMDNRLASVYKLNWKHKYLDVEDSTFNYLRVLHKKFVG